ncbi:hypothetical protein M33023_03790 [Candidatus Phytoplasma asteris]|jgi:hypothetical protein|uniref:Uncharacterized protein n=3 Tax=16SrI (Aster yellows group) TaxID=3042590 RepID=A0A859I9B0_9MOLU|nr:MAG: hypothetical protein RP166_1700 [Rapeseed phyllody phytoplasma]TKA87677.1 MAG: hypothetical protein PLY_8270 [Periwinkle leaf yellowing phytoplasma]WEX19461.1 MAG: hypothetical protein QS2022_1790 [Candidatus Phytoplasma asteris]QKX95243.1 MAG: hypothetical protein RP166_2480 [Rapeseed phyllody phytoplasma]TKA87835.1 MAG: hypothetical protein PLY_5160 [Periwinkle leaf yellowing phytoplasma]
MTLRQILILIALGCIFIFAAYKLGFIVPDATKITWIK